MWQSSLTFAQRVDDCPTKRLNLSSGTESRRTIIAQNQNTFEKRKREMDKKAKADAKRARKAQKNRGAGAAQAADPFYRFSMRATSEDT